MIIPLVSLWCSKFWQQSVFFWFLILLVLRLLGNRVGCANGQSATIPAEAMKDNGSNSFGEGGNSEDSGEFIVMQADQNRINRIRIIFFICGLLAVLTAGMVIFSIVNVQVSFNDLYTNAANVQSLIRDTPEDLVELNQIAAEFDIARNSLASELAGFCTMNTDISESASNFLRTVTNVDDISASSNDAWSDVSLMVEEAEKIITATVNFLDFAKNPGSAWFICSMAFAFLSILGTMFFLLLAWKSGNAGFEFVGEVEWSKRHLLTRYVAAPLYMLLALLTWFAAGVAFAGTTINADFCYDEITTGHGVHKILENKGYASTDNTYKIIDGYLHNCSDQDSVPHELIEMYSKNLTAASLYADEFMALSEVNMTVCSNVSSNTSALVMSLATNATDRISTLQSAFSSVRNDLSCKQIAPLIQRSVYESGCVSLIRSFTWAWICLLGLSTWCTLIVMLRTATHRPQIFIVPTDESIEPIDSYDNSYDGTRVSKRASKSGRGATFSDRSRMSRNASNVSRDVTVYS